MLEVVTANTLAEAAQAEVADRIHGFGSLTVRVPESFCACRLPAVIALVCGGVFLMWLLFIQSSKATNSKIPTSACAFFLTNCTKA